MTEDELLEDAKHWKAIADSRQEEIDRLKSVLSGIADYCSGDDRSLGAIVRLASVHNTARQALRVTQQETSK